MKRGTRVGQAYIAVTADGDGINEEIVSSVDAAGDDIDKKGDEQGESYGDHFSDGFFARLRKRFGPQIEEELGSRMDRAGKSSGDRLGASMVDSLRARLTAEEDKIAGLLDTILGDNGRSDKRMTRLTTALAASEGAAGRLNKELIETVKLEQRIASAASSVSGNGKNRRIGDTLGGLFGAGSRNNALNLFGKSIAGIVNLSETLFNSLRKFPSLLAQFAEGWKGAAEGASFFQKVGAGIGEEGMAALKGLASSGPAAAVALAAVAAAMTLLVSVANALLAILTALVATIVSALVGALAVAAAGFAVLAGAVGLGVLAFMSMTDAQKALLSGAFRPLHQEAIGLGQVILKDLVPAFDVWSKNLQVALAYAYPLAQIMGGTLAQAGTILSAALSGPGIQLFITSLTQMVGGVSMLQLIITNLSTALGGFLNGTAGLFAALIPYVLQFSEYLNRVATRFANWASSAQGQNAITDFVSRALVSLQSLWGFLKALGGLIVAVLFSPQGQNAGNNIFDRMAAAVRKFTAYLSKDNRLQKWFDEGVTFAVALGEAIKTIGKMLQRLNQSGVIDGIASLVDIGAGVYEWFSRLPRVIQDLINPIQGFADVIGHLGSTLATVMSYIGGGGVVPVTSSGTNPGSGTLSAVEDAIQNGIDSGTSPTSDSLQALIDSLTGSGASALSATGTGSGGYKAPKDPDALSQAMQNYYDQVAAAILKDMPTYADTIKKALRDVTKTIQGVLKQSNLDFAQGLKDAALAGDATTVMDSIKSLVASQISTMQSTVESLKSNAASMVSSAQDAVNSAAQALADATTKSGAREALAALAVAQDQLDQAEAYQNKINKRIKKLKAAMAAANAIAAQQAVFTYANASMLAQGFKVEGATLADYADARAQVADKLVAANQKLQEAIALRDNFRTAITDAINSFAALTTAQAKTINGVEQALTSTDITDNLQTKLDQIKKFQTNLHILLSQGLSQAAYKQLLDAGVEQGGAFAQALVNGGQGGVQHTNQLVAQIADVADQLGLEASNRMYQAGVDAAQGLVDGLTSLSAQLDSAAVALGNAIAAAIANALGIHSPSKVMYDYMRDGVGDGIVGGLDASHRKVGAAAGRLSSQIAVSPEVASYASSQGGSGYEGRRVSGNQSDPRFRDLVVHTPTENPKAVAMEVLNEVTGRL